MRTRHIVLFRVGRFKIAITGPIPIWCVGIVVSNRGLGIDIGPFELGFLINPKRRVVVNERSPGQIVAPE